MGKLEPCAVLVGAQAGAAAVEDSVAVPQKTKSGVPIQPSDPTSGCSPEGTGSRIHNSQAPVSRWTEKHRVVRHTMEC